jgi:hypothetical protein
MAVMTRMTAMIPVVEIFMNVPHTIYSTRIPRPCGATGCRVQTDTILGYVLKIPDNGKDRNFFVISRNNFTKYSIKRASPPPSGVTGAHPSG